VKRPDFPVFHRQLPDSELWDVVPAGDWIPLTPLPKDYADHAPHMTSAEAHLRAEAASKASEVYGTKSKRLGRSVERLTFEVPDDWEALTGHKGFEAVYMTPRLWEATQMRRVYREAVRILSRVGLPLNAYEVWCFRDPAGGWWALPDFSATDLIAPKEEALQGAWCLYFRGRKGSPATEYPVAFAEELSRGGGAMEWAWWARGAVRQLQEMVQMRRVAIRELEDMSWTPEWRAFVKATEARADPVSVSALRTIQGLIQSDGLSGIGGAFIEGFEIGRGLGFHTAHDALRQAELARTETTVKGNLNARLLDLIGEAKQKPPYRPYAHAKRIRADELLFNELKRLGLGSLSVKSLGEKLRLLSPKP
jgi:hypothetical protein